MNPEVIQFGIVMGVILGVFFSILGFVWVVANWDRFSFVKRHRLCKEAWEKEKRGKKRRELTRLLLRTPYDYARITSSDETDLLVKKVNNLENKIKQLTRKKRRETARRKPKAGS